MSMTRASTARMAPREAWNCVLRLALGTHALALADQAVVSGASFLTTILIGRWTNSRELGFYAISISVLSSIIAIQDSLIALPYAILNHRLQGTPAERAGNALTYNLLLSALAVIVIVGTALGLTLYAGPQVMVIAWAMAAATPFVLLREFGRRFGFAHLQMGNALALDAGVAAVQLGILSWLQSKGLMSASAALGAIGAACGLTGILWVAIAKGSFSTRRIPTRTAIADNWGLGKWLFASVITVQVQWYATYWLSVLIMGAAVTGVYTACMSVVSFANPLIAGIGNILTPRAVLAWKKDGAVGLRRQAIWDALFLGAAMGSVCFLIFFAGEKLMHLLYVGKEYEGYGHTLSVLAVALLAQAVGAPASSALASMERPRAIVLVGGIGTVVTVLLVWILMVEGGLPGAAYGFLLGNVVGATGRWGAFLALVRRTSNDPASLLHVIEQITGCSPGGGCAISRIGVGDHATVISIHSNDSGPIWRAHQCLALKLYKPEAGLNAELVRAQFDSLAKLHSALNGRVIDDWKISVPEPLFICNAPLAMVMTMVPGKNIYSWIANGGNPTPEALEAAARTVVGALKQSWELGQAHGDLALQNILCDVQAKILSFVDSGTQESCFICYDECKPWSPAVRDLAHMLSDVATDVKRTIAHKSTRSRQSIFAECALEAFLETVGSREEKRKQLIEVRACTRAHMDDLLEPLQSPRGLWRRLVKQIALRRLDLMFDKLNAGLDASWKPLQSSDLNVKNRRR